MLTLTTSLGKCRHRSVSSLYSRRSAHSAGPYRRIGREVVWRHAGRTNLRFFLFWRRRGTKKAQKHAFSYSFGPPGVPKRKKTLYFTKPLEKTNKATRENNKSLEKTNNPLEKITKATRENNKPLEKTNKPLEKTNNPIEKTTKPLEKTTSHSRKQPNPLEKTTKPLDKITNHDSTVPFWGAPCGPQRSPKEPPEPPGGGPWGTRRATGTTTQQHPAGPPHPDRPKPRKTQRFRANESNRCLRFNLAGPP